MPKKKITQPKLRKTANQPGNNRRENIHDRNGSHNDTLLRGRSQRECEALMDFDPIEIRGEYLSTTISRERR
jgi:hypothetical protein